MARIDFMTAFGSWMTLPDELAASLGSVEHLDIDREHRAISMAVRCSSLCARANARFIEKSLVSLFSLREAHFSPKYSSDMLSSDYIHEIIAFMRDESMPVNGFFEGASFSLDGDDVVIKLTNGGEQQLELFGCSKRMQELIYEQFSREINVRYSGVTKLDEQNVLLRRLEEKQKQAKPVSAAPAGKAFTFNADGLPLVPNTMQLILGRTFTGKPMPIAEINETSGRVLIWGDIFKMDRHDTRDGKRTILSFFVTDYTSSIIVRSIVESSKPGPLANLRVGDTIVLQGDASFDKYEKDLTVRPYSVVKVKKQLREDKCAEKRIELHAHTKMSALDGFVDAKTLIKTAAKFGHPAIAITDHGVVQAFPDAAAAASDCKKAGTPIKVIYGVEGYLVNDMIPAVVGDGNEPLSGELIVFDLETTGLSAATEKIIEIGAVKMRDGEIVEEFNTFVDPECVIPDRITEITGITTDMVRGAPKEQEAMEAFYAFCGREDATLIAHNAPFDTSFVKAAAKRCKMP